MFSYVKKHKPTRKIAIFYRDFSKKTSHFQSIVFGFYSDINTKWIVDPATKQFQWLIQTMCSVMSTVKRLIGIQLKLHALNLKFWIHLITFVNEYSTFAKKHVVVNSLMIKRKTDLVFCQDKIRIELCVCVQFYVPCKMSQFQLSLSHRVQKQSNLTIFPLSPYSRAVK